MNSWGASEGVLQQLMEVSGWLTGSGVNGEGMGVMDGVWGRWMGFGDDGRGLGVADGVLGSYWGSWFS